MPRLIAGDIGGTKTILRLLSATGTDAISTDLERTYSSQAYSDLVPMVREFLADISADRIPEIACFAIAGPVVDGRSRLTNLDWELDTARLARELNLERVELLNDFAAMSYGVVQLPPKDRHVLQAGTPRSESPVGVIGAGTGLGEAFLIRDGGAYRVFATEGGHADFAPRSELEYGLLADIRRRHQLDRVSVERVVSGQGVLAIYQFLRDRGEDPEAPKIAALVRAQEQGQPTATDPAAEISKAATDQSNALCEKTLELFVGAYAAEAGNLALKLLPYGGLYIAGGIAAKILPLLERYRFVEIFKQKGRISAVLDGVPLQVALNPKAGLLGSVAYALRLK